MNKPMTKQEWLPYIETTWDAAQREAWGESPRREWVGLTHKEFCEVTEGLEDLEDCWIAIEAKLKEKNNG